MAVPKIKGQDINTYVALGADPYDMVDHLHEVVKLLRDTEEYDDEADDLEDAATELKQIFNRIFDTIEDGVEYEH